MLVRTIIDRSIDRSCVRCDVLGCTYCSEYRYRLINNTGTSFSCVHVLYNFYKGRRLLLGWFLGYPKAHLHTERQVDWLVSEGQGGMVSVCSDRCSSDDDAIGVLDFHGHSHLKTTYKER